MKTTAKDSATRSSFPEAAHGTNPASAARCGYKTLTVKSDSRGGGSIMANT